MGSRQVFSAGRILEHRLSHEWLQALSMALAFFFVKISS
jgi:hypothetical protein